MAWQGVADGIVEHDVQHEQRAWGEVQDLDGIPMQRPPADDLAVDTSGPPS